MASYRNEANINFDLLKMNISIVPINIVVFVYLSDFFDISNMDYKLALFSEPSVRAELMEQVPHIAMYCHTVTRVPGDHLTTATTLHLIPLVVRYLTDTNNQVNN